VPDEQLSPHFRLKELLRSPAAASEGLPNAPTEQQRANLKRLCEELLKPVAAEVGGLVVSSGLRQPEVNALIGGSRTSSHCALGEAAAADVVPKKPGVTLREIVERVQRSGLAFDQVIYEFGRWVHLSDRHTDGRQRRQVLMAFRENGSTVYRPFDARDPRVLA
jgi:hypothetical protein